VAALVTGDKDFMPAMTRTRQRGKRVAIVSTRNNCAGDLVAAQSHVRDFEPIFLERHLSDLLVPISPTHYGLGPVLKNNNNNNKKLSSASVSAALSTASAGEMVRTMTTTATEATGASSSSSSSSSRSGIHDVGVALMRAIVEAIQSAGNAFVAGREEEAELVWQEEQGKSAPEGSRSGGSKAAQVITVSAKRLGRELTGKLITLPDGSELFASHVSHHACGVLCDVCCESSFRFISCL
jgi:hypothetical protein